MDDNNKRKGKCEKNVTLFTLFVTLRNILVKLLSAIDSTVAQQTWAITER